MSDAPIISDSVAVDTGNAGLESDSYVASRLKHASPEHLHITSRRFFIGPIPEGWLNSNRKTWYKRRLELTNYSSQNASFTTAEQHGPRQRTATNLQRPSIAARMQFSFPQPEDIKDSEASAQHLTEPAEDDDDDTDEEIETTALAPVSTNEAPPVFEDANQDSTRSILSNTAGKSEDDADAVQSINTKGRVESWETAREDQQPAPTTAGMSSELERESRDYGHNRQSTSTHGAGISPLQSHGYDAAVDNMDSSSRTALLQSESRVETPEQDRPRSRGLIKHTPAPVHSSSGDADPGQKAQGVRFKVTEGVADRQRRIAKRVDSARLRVSNKMVRRDTMKEGTIVKMERMLVRIDVTVQQLPDDFDENESIKTETKPIEKWTEFMVVARKSNQAEGEDFRLQFYKTRVIPQIDSESTKKKPAREIKLKPNSTHVNLFSSLDKTVVIWHPFRKGTRIFILRPSSAAHSVEWYTFLQDALGWHRSPTLQVIVPDLDVSLQLEKPFEDLQAANTGAEDEETALSRTAEAEKAVAGRIISQSMEMLEKDPAWVQVLQMWSESANMGLAWKRYDRLEWVYGVNEQKMFGSMAMQNSYDLELRPKHHYPTSTHGKKGVIHKEPPPIEGFLIRLTSQKGVQKRLGKAYYKRLYFSTFDQYLFFNRPAKATPPHPPRLASIGGNQIPSAAEIVQKTPLMFEVDPIKVENGKVSWFETEQQSAFRQHDLEALWESRRSFANLVASDGYVDLRHIVKVRKIKWGASEADEYLDSGSDVDFHADVENTTQEDGTTTEIDDDRIFELLLENELVVRLQAYNKETRDAWMKRLTKLVKYWKLRTTADITSLKSIRQSNLTSLNIDEGMEARLGQFAHKWEVNRSEASPDLYNMCRLSACRAITMSGSLYRKTRKHATFQQCSVILTDGQMLVYQSTLRKGTGEQVAHAHQEKQQVVDLRGCYIYSGLIVEEDLLYQNRTFDANHAGMLAATPRIYLEDNWTSADVDVMTCFVVWTNRRKGWFRSVISDGDDAVSRVGTGPKGTAKGGTRSRIKRVTQLGVPGRGVVFKCRSRAERDLWVLAVAAEIETAVEKELREQGKQSGQELDDVRLEG